MGNYISGAATGAGGTKKTELKQLVVKWRKNTFYSPKTIQYDCQCQRVICEHAFTQKSPKSPKQFQKAVQLV